MSIELVDRELCNGCGLCVITCPLDVVRLDTKVADLEEWPDCRRACPAGVDMRAYMYLLKNGQADEAMEVLREALPLPAVTGRVCPHPCESECVRREVDEAVNINALERFVADRRLNEKAQPVHQIYSAKVAVVGSGPAGLSCAYFLTGMGYAVTVLEAQPVLGGMLRLGIPEYRLPRDVLDAQIDYIRDLGVEFKTAVCVGKDVTLQKLQKQYSAVFYAVGNPLSRKMEMERIDFAGVLWGLDFLTDVNLGRGAKVGERVVVIGGGNVAIDVALTALRTGARSVDLACLEKTTEMPAFDEGVEQALEEGVRIHDGWGPKRILGGAGKVTGIELARCTSIYGDRGQYCPAYDETKTKLIDTDTIILAIGQAADLSALPRGLTVTKGGAIQVDAITLETSLPGVFAGGDVVSGPASVVQAIAAGRRASDSIDRYLKRQDLKAGRYLLPKRVKKAPKEGMEPLARNATRTLLARERTGAFKEIKAGFDEDVADLEAQRCLTCGSRAVISYVDDCMLCLHCEHYCPQKAIYVSPDKRVAPLVPWG
jgi:NADPH-dependent glutamate synthase beta subunit-like oxidoreductase